MSDSPELTTKPDRVSRVVSINIPLKVIAPFVVAAAVSLVDTHFTLRSHSEAFRTLQATVQKSNEIQIAMQTDIAVLKIKYENLDGIVRAMQAEKGKK